jgi:osmotically-inducible protein OsmY
MEAANPVGMDIKEARPDADILADVRRAIWSEDTIRSIDLGSLSVDVRQGEVFLWGHVSTYWNSQQIEDLARQTPGVVRVNDSLVVDYTLTLQVAQALARDPRTRHYIVHSGASHGWISLSGVVPTHEARNAIEEVSGAVPDVRGIVALPRVDGEPTAEERRPLQPQLDAKVFAKDGPAGWVGELILNPVSRLVSHIAVGLGPLGYEDPAKSLRVIPVDVIDLVREGSVFLVVRARVLSDSPLFDPHEYPLAPESWKPPYPYLPGTVRWLCPPAGCEEEQMEQVGQQILVDDAMVE